MRLYVISYTFRDNRIVIQWPREDTEGHFCLAKKIIEGFEKDKWIDKKYWFSWNLQRTGYKIPSNGGLVIERLVTQIRYV